MRGASSYQYSSMMPVVSSRVSKAVSHRPIVAQGYRPAYAAAPAKYFGTTATGSVRAGAVSRPSARSAASTRYFDPTYPSRQFGSRLAKGYTGIHTRPSLHEESYGTSFLPGYGRDSWSAYKVSDSSMDLGDDIAYLSKRRDYEVLRDVERAMAQAANPTFKRASSVPPQHLQPRGQSKARGTSVIRHTANVRGKPKGLSKAMSQSQSNLYYNVSTPKVKIVHETVPSGRDLLTAKEKLLSREVVDLESPSGTMALKMRLADAHALLDRQGAMLSRYGSGAVDKDMVEIDSEVRRIRNSQAMRAKSVM